MFAKRGLMGSSSKRYLLLFSLVLLLTVSFVSAQTGRECTVPAYSTIDHCESRSIFTPGYGAVELCQVCFQCGVNDGVCPEDYSDGILEGSTQKLTMMMRVGRPVLYGDSYSVGFSTGNDACAQIGGDCNHIERSTDSISWNLVPGGCALDVTSNNAYFRAVCENVPRTAGCEHCPDHDCEATISGMTYNVIDNSYISGVTIKIGPSSNTNLNLPAVTSDFNGLYEIPSAVTGYLDITCSKPPDFLDYTIRQYIRPGRNIVDCKMSERGVNCTPQCYYTDSSGNQICSAVCDGINGCNMTELAKVGCEGRPYLYKAYLNDTVFVNTTDSCSYENSTYLNCCKGELSSQILQLTTDCIPMPPPPSFYIESNVSNMLTRTYKKELNGRTITLSIRTYTK